MVGAGGGGQTVEAAAAAEAAFNIGRLFHGLGMSHLAQAWYYRCLDIRVPQQQQQRGAPAALAVNLRHLCVDSS